MKSLHVLKIPSFLMIALVWTLSFLALTSTQSTFSKEVKDISHELQKIAGLRFNELSSQRPGYRLFQLWFTQPADHANPQGETFEQSLVLWHLDAASPMILQTSGYAIFGNELTKLASEMKANQIQVEHRFFQSSTPASRDHQFLTIEQSAADFHRITQAFKPLYRAKWANTGRSKGGMTAVFHRRFYPNDVDATIAHVAPLSFNDNDQRYVQFLSEEIGGPLLQECREKLKASQRLLLESKHEVQALPVTGAFSLIGSHEIAVEHAILGLAWAFWQYDAPSRDCENVPSPDAELKSHLNFLMQQSHPSDLSDERLMNYSSYFYQAATQLGSPGDWLEPFQDLLQFLDTFTIQTFVPRDLNPVFDGGAAMQDISHWMATQSERMIFVYGANDPWTAATFEARAAGDSYKFVIPSINHVAQFSDLSGPDRDLAYSKIKEWLGISAEATKPSSLSQPFVDLEKIEIQSLRRSPIF